MTSEKPRTLRAANGVTHAFVRESLAWRVNGTLEPALRERIDAHLADCAECRAELAFEERVAHRVREESGIELAPRAGLLDVMARIDRRERRRRWWRPLAAFAHPMPVAVALQAGVIVALAAFIVFAPERRSAPAYRALTNAAPAVESSGVALRVVFSDDLSLGELRALLERSGATIAGGPRGGGAYTLRVGDDVAAQRAVAALRSDPRVRLAEITVTP